jgi:hypothetical protein
MGRSGIGLQAALVFVLAPAGCASFQSIHIIIPPERKN